MGKGTNNFPFFRIFAPKITEDMKNSIKRELSELACSAERENSRTKCKVKLKQLILCLLVLLTMTACGGKTGKATGSADSLATESVVVSDDGFVPTRSGYTFRSEVRTITEDDEVRWDTIVVYLTDARGQTTKLYSQALPLDTAQWNKGSIGEITEDDWNFDGIPDLQVCTGPMNGFGNNTYDVWLWDDQTHKFMPLDDISGIFDPYVDTDNKCIVSTWRLDDEVEIVRYKWKDGKLVESDREEMSYSDLTED